MPNRLTTLTRQQWLGALVVLAFALRALVPTGFMPGGTGALTLQVCPDGFPAALLAAPGDSHAGHRHHQPEGSQHDHQSWTSGHCVFSAVAGAPPVTHSPIAIARAEIAMPSVRPDVAPVFLDIRFRIAQPRAPPHLA